MKKGDIVLLEIPLSNGHEQSGARPAIIFSEEIGNEELEESLLKEIDNLLIKMLK